MKDKQAAPIAFFDYGLALQNRGQWQPSRDSYRSALAREPDFPDALNGLGNCEENSGHPRKAAVLYRKAARTYLPAVANLERLGRIDVIDNMRSSSER